MKEELQCRPLTKLLKLSSCIPGITLNRGQMLSVNDLGSVTGGKLIFDVGDCCIIISEYNCSVQCAVCSVQCLLVKSVEHLTNTNGKTSDLTAVTEIEGESVEILDVEKILGEISSVKIDLSVEAQKQLAIDKDKPYHMMGSFACGQKANHPFTGVAGATKIDTAKDGRSEIGINSAE
ncbi:MAG: chemotaxis protein CheW [Shewanella sp.]|nr:chemotaxis protein CheW [Shewanella sp.]